MSSQTLQVQIVHYHPDYASRIADMWNQSNDSWGGGSNVRTAEQIIQQEASSDSLVVFLALLDDEVVGYCSLCEFRDDTGALYIQLLNVRPDCHGKGIGKMLVLQAVEETIKRGWKRLDLHTWGSNTKAVPLYKRCGFFWEERDDQVHLMNFIPQLLATEALQPYMNQLDWYKDSTREIVIAPDVQEDNGFHKFTYTWNKDNHPLRVELERRGRGISLIETEDYCIAAQVECTEPVIGREYQVQYRVQNKSGAPLHISLCGKNDQNILFDWQEEVEVVEQKLLTATFFVEAMEEESNPYRTCPTVHAEMIINGLSADFKVGVLPRFPVKVSLKVPNLPYARHAWYTCYVDIDNQYDTPANCSFTLPQVPWMELERDTFNIQLDAKAKVSVQVPFQLLDYGFYESKLMLECTPENGETVQISRPIGNAFSGPGAVLLGENEDMRIAINGRARLDYYKDSNQLSIYTIGKNGKGVFLLFPRIGMPYSSEFSKKKPEKVERLYDHGGVGFKHTYRSDTIASMLLHMNVLLYGDGTVRLWQELELDNDTPLHMEFRVSQRIHMPLYRAVLPYKGEVIELQSSEGTEYDKWLADDITEPWMFSAGEGNALGICWSDAHQMTLGNWFLDIESMYYAFQPHEIKRSPDILLSIGGFQDWQSFRTFALKGKEHEASTAPMLDLQLCVNENNPFMSADQEQLSVTLKDHKKNTWRGEIEAAYAHAEASEHVRYTYDGQSNPEEAQFVLKRPSKDLNTVQMQIRLDNRLEHLQSTVFRVDAGFVQCKESEREGYITHLADNGVIQIRAEAGYYNGLNSLIVNGREWLASGFPHYAPKSWWNPWVGGMQDQISDVRTHNVLKEKRSAAFVKVVDSKGNTWSGIRLRQSIQKQKVCKGLMWESYYLMQPGVPVVAYFTDIHQLTGAFMEEKKQIHSEMFLPISQAEGLGWIDTLSKSGEPHSYRLGCGDLGVEENNHYRIRRDEEPLSMYVVIDESRVRASAFTNKEVTGLTLSRQLGLPHGSVTRLAPVYLVFTEQTLTAHALDSLRRITFPITPSSEE